MLSSFRRVSYSAKPYLLIGISIKYIYRFVGRNKALSNELKTYNISIFYVTRRTPETRQKAKEDIKTRSLSPDQELPQLFLCPEGTNTNRRVLIQFKVINGFEFLL